MRLPAIPRRGRRDRRSRGQSLVEFALVLPLILMLTLIALDFGRVYLGWINLQSMARIGANLAANNPTAWSGSGDAAVKARYQNQIKNDATANNCHLPSIGGVESAPAPTFTGTSLGDKAKVALTCTFGVITPGISAILGGSVKVSSSAVFPVKSGMTVSDGSTGGVPPNAAFTGNGAVTPSSLSGPAPFNVVFRDTSGGNPTSWLWEFNDGSVNSTSIERDPLDHLFALPGTYLVKMTATNALGSSTATMGVTVTAPSVVDFTANRTSGAPPLSVNFSSTSTAGGTGYAWTFGTGQGTGMGAAVNHVYGTPGTYSVTLTVTYPVGGNITQTKTNYITVNSGLCIAPHLDGIRRYSAQAAWTGAGFTGTVSDGSGAPSGNYIITTQSIVALSSVPCTSAVVVNRP